MSALISPVGALAGLLFGLGGWLVAARVAARRPTLDARLAPYLRAPQPRRPWDAAAPTRGPLATVERLLAPVMADAVRLVERVGSPNADLAGRLRRAGRAAGVEQARVEQVVAAVLGTGAGLGLALVIAAGRGLPVPAGIGLIAGGAVAGLVGHDLLLSRQIGRRTERILLELPSVAELLALAVAAGESATAAIERVARVGSGELAAELGAVVADTRSGTPLAQALDRLTALGIPALTRFVEAVVIAVERGTPLADVLRAQAGDVRESARRELMELGGRKEVAMMVPVVFVILPVTVIFAVFPGLSALRLDL